MRPPDGETAESTPDAVERPSDVNESAHAVGILARPLDMLREIRILFCGSNHQ